MYWQQYFVILGDYCAVNVINRMMWSVITTSGAFRNLKRALRGTFHVYIFKSIQHLV